MPILEVQNIHKSFGGNNILKDNSLPILETIHKFFQEKAESTKFKCPSTEKYDRGEKKEIYRQQEVDEYWIVDSKKKQVFLGKFY